MVAEQNGDVNANRDNSGSWETFTVTRLENGQFSLKSDHGKYLIAKEDGTLNSNSPSVVTEGMFLIAIHGNTGTPTPWLTPLLVLGKNHVKPNLCPVI